MNYPILALVLFVFTQTSAQVPTDSIVVSKPGFKGYYFLRQGNYLKIKDAAGNTIFYQPTETAGFDFTLWQNGLMSYPDHNKILVMDSSFNIIDSIAMQNAETDLHEFRILANGNYLLLGAEDTIMDLSKYYWKGDYGIDSAKVKSPVIQELDKNRRVVFEWHALKYFTFDDVDTFFLFPHHNIVDWMHVNAVEQDNDGNFLISIRNFNSIIKVDRNTHQLLWIFGGKLNQFSITGLQLPFYGPHDVRRLRNGHLTLFDGGFHYNNKHGARLLEFELNEKNKTANLVWSYTYDPNVQSTRCGNFQRISNSMCLFNIGYPDKGKFVFAVIDSNQKKLFEMKGEPSYRVHYYSSLPFTMHQPAVNVIDSAGQVFLAAAKTYLNYNWSTGDTTRIIKAMAGMKYQLFVPYGNNGFIGSKPIQLPHQLPTTKTRASLTKSH